MPLDRMFMPHKVFKVPFDDSVPAVKNIAFIHHRCDPSTWNFVGITREEYMANHFDGTEDLLAFPVGLFGEGLPPGSVFECAAGCLACDTLLFARFQWEGAKTVWLPGGGRSTKLPEERPDPMFDPVVTDAWNEEVAKVKANRRDAEKKYRDAGVPPPWSPEGRAAARQAQAGGVDLADQTSGEAP